MVHQMLLLLRVLMELCVPSVVLLFGIAVHANSSQGSETVLISIPNVEPKNSLDAANVEEVEEPLCHESDAPVNISAFSEEGDEDSSDDGDEDSSDDDWSEGDDGEEGTKSEEDEGTISEQEEELSDEDLKSYGFEDLWSYLNCRAHVKRDKPLFTPQMWARMRSTYAELADFDLGPFQPNPNYYSDYSDGKGRGTFAARDFKKGELVHDGSLSTVFWEDGQDWKNYVVSLPTPMACDVLEWTWIQEVKEEGWLLCLNLNDAAFLNDGGEDSNIAPRDKTSLTFYAVRDIKEDEELVYDYDLYQTYWYKFDL